MSAASQRSGATLALHHLGSPVPPAHDHAADAEGDELRLARVAAAFRGFMESLGLNLRDPDLAGTEQRVARAYRELLSGLRPDAEPRLSTFPNSEGYAGIVAVTGIPFYSICAHHFLPVFGTADIGYIPGDRLAGLSKLARVVDFFARRPQLQERLTEQIATLLEERLAPAGVIVSVQARHFCMEMRGVKTQGTTTTIALRGTLKDARLQQQFFARLRRAGAQSPAWES
ncbi:MAG TPA: GTP cyclohydrolase I [Gemmatimonadales bacterium]|jgi:GTP cyclohydrolase I|nr:GTP cyclohydrolase I [Gemmatimonadales bacterium]